MAFRQEISQILQILLISHGYHGYHGNTRKIFIELSHPVILSAHIY